MYDHTGATGDAQGHEGFGGDPFSQFRNGFGGFQGGSAQGGMGFEDIFKEFFKSGGQRGQPQEEPTMMAMEISFNEAVNGISKVPIHLTVDDSIPDQEGLFFLQGNESQSWHLAHKMQLLRWERSQNGETRNDGNANYLSGLWGRRNKDQRVLLSL